MDEFHSIATISFHRQETPDAYFLLLIRFHQ